MNIYGLIVLVTLLFGYLLDMITNLLNLRSLKGDLPQEFQGVFDAEEYRKSQAYTRVNTRFGFITSTVSLLATMIFWFAGGFNIIDLMVREWQLNPIFTGLIYIGLLIILRSVLGLPFSIYSTFVIEEHFGFNKTTPKIFILDILKGLLLGILLGGPLLAVLLFFFDYAGTYAWLYCWAGTTVFTLLVQFIAPTWIMPLFNKFTPMEDGELRRAITGYAEKVKFPLKGIFVMDGSKRSTKSNAFFTGIGRNKRIALYDTLIERHSNGELLGILAHEIGHVQAKHGLQAIKKSRITSALTTIGVEGTKTFGGAELAQLTETFEDSISDITSTIVNNGYSRSFERQADEAAVTILTRVGYDPNGLVDMLTVMSRRLKPGGLDFAKTHPSPASRIADICGVIGETTEVTEPKPRQVRFLAALGNI